MRNSPITIAFEGVHRVGKGTQIEKLSTALTEASISHIILRGDGTREGLGLHIGDPLSPWWQQYSRKLRESGTSQEWHEAAYHLMTDFLAWRKAKDSLQKQVILLDRSILSRATFVLDRERPMNETLTINQLYPVKQSEKFSLEDILPDLIFEFVAPKEVLLSRLDPNDPKLRFRAKMIESAYDIAIKAKERLPKQVQERIITIDATLPIDKIFDYILETLNDRVTLFKEKIKPD